MRLASEKQCFKMLIAELSSSMSGQPQLHALDDPASSISKGREL